MHSQTGRLARVEDSAKRVLSFSWDGAGRLIKVEAPGQELKLQRDPAGDVVAMQRGESEVLIQRDPTGLPVRAGDVAWSRDLNGWVSAVRWAGLDLRMERDPAGWLRPRHERNPDFLAQPLDHVPCAQSAPLPHTPRARKRARAAVALPGLRWRRRRGRR